MTELPPTTQSFLEQLAAHDHDAWSSFLNVYGASIHEYCIRRGLQDSEANDVRQDVLVAVEQQLNSGKHDPEKGSFRGWIFGVSRNLINQTIRKRNRLIATGDSNFMNMLDELEEARTGLSGEFELEYRRQLFKWAAELVKRRINDSSWQAFWKTTIDGTPSIEVAQELGMTVGAVYTAKCRVIAHLQKQLEEIPDDLIPNDVKEVPDSVALAATLKQHGESSGTASSNSSSVKNADSVPPKGGEE